MTRFSDRSYFVETLNIFQAFTDLMANAFMILSFFLVLNLLQFVGFKTETLQNAAPIIIDEKSGDFRFPSGSAQISSEFQDYIENNVVRKILAVNKIQKIEFIQIIGHTDSQPINTSSNLDLVLLEVAQSRNRVETLNAGSNADLGLIRAFAVIQALQRTGKLNGIKFRAYSAAQLYSDNEGTLASLADKSDDESRRRIEIRFIPPGKKDR